MSRHPISEVKDKVDFTLNVAGINVLSQVGLNPSFPPIARLILFRARSLSYCLAHILNRSLKLLRFTACLPTPGMLYKCYL
jgi:hypothetical protein